MKVWRIRHDESGLFHNGGTHFSEFRRNPNGFTYSRLSDIKAIKTRCKGLPNGYSVIEYELGEGKEIEL